MGRHDRNRGEENLYDLARDPYEKEDLASDPARRARCDELRAAALAWWRATGGGPLELP